MKAKQMRLAKFLVAAVFAVVAFASVAVAQTQAILPNGMTQFSDGNGAPYVGGHVYMYVPYTTTPKATYQDPYGATPNSNPITLDSNGRAILWGNGVYRQVLRDLNGVVIWDQLTYTSPASAGSGGTGTLWYGTAIGTANSITLTGPIGFNATDGQSIGFIANATNTGSTTINAGGFGSLLVEKNTPAGVVALSGGEIAAGTLTYATYSTSAATFILQATIPGTPGTGVVNFVGTAVGGTANAVTVTAVAYGVWANTYGNSISFIPTVLNTGATTLQVGSSTVKNLYRQVPAGIAVMVGGELAPRQIASATFDGTEFVLTSADAGPPPGEIAMFNLAACPNGWTAADGTSGTADMRGVVARGLDNGRGLDTSGTALAGYEADMFQTHTMVAPQSGSFLITGYNSGSNYGFNGNAGPAFQPTSAYGSTGGPNSGNYGYETRAKATVLLGCQKL